MIGEQHYTWVLLMNEQLPAYWACSLLTGATSPTINYSFITVFGARIYIGVDVNIQLFTLSKGSTYVICTPTMTLDASESSLLLHTHLVVWG